MTQEAYRFAYDEANAELREILGQFELLRARKEQIEQVVEALKALLTDSPLPETSAEGRTEAAPFLVQQTILQQIGEATPEVKAEAAVESFPEPSFEPEPAYAAEQSSDPFQRRIDMALRHGLGSRESRILPRALNGLLSRA